MKLNLGCGSDPPKDWINVDYALGARLCRFSVLRHLNKKLRIFSTDWSDNIYIHDLTKEFPWPAASIDIVYTSHTLEHFSKEQGRRFLRQCHKVLKKGGIMRIVVPDLKYIVKKYLNGGLRADDFTEDLGVLYWKGRDSIKNKLSFFIRFPHRCMYDAPSLIELLNQIGFSAHNKKPFDSDITDINAVEVENHTLNALIVEGRKK